MKMILTLILVVLLTSCETEAKQSSGVVTVSTSGGNEIMRLVQTIPLPNVEGRIDHLSIDVKGQRLFVAALGNNTVEVLDLNTGKLIHSIFGLSEPQGVLFIPEINKIYVTNGGNGLFDIFDGSSFASLGHIELSDNADNIRYDGSTRSVVVGYGDGGLSIINVDSGKVVTSIKLEGHPESFQLESSGSNIFVNIPSANQIAVVDRQQKKVVAKWTLSSATANYPMALDEKQHRLFVGFRSPANMKVYDTETGKLVTTLGSVGDVDDIFYDATHKMVFVIGGEGFIDLFSQQDADHYQLITRIPTASGARTGLWVPEVNRLYAAVPHHGTQQAEIRSYELQP